MGHLRLVFGVWLLVSDLMPQVNLLPFGVCSLKKKHPSRGLAPVGQCLCSLSPFRSIPNHTYILVDGGEAQPFSTLRYNSIDRSYKTVYTA